MTEPTHKAIILDLIDQIVAEVEMTRDALYANEMAEHFRVALQRLRELRKEVKRHE